MSVTPIPVGSDGYYHPSSEGELALLVRHAYDNSRQLRVRGSAHSVPTAIYTNGYDGTGAPPSGSIDVMLDQYRGVTITPDPETGEADVVVEAGCNLGKNPYDPTGTSTWENSLNDKLQRAGYALGDTGGITHQTISGFMSTGSSGGSLTYTFEDNLVGIDLIDGTGQIHRLRRDDPDPKNQDMFHAAGVSMGLLGVISKVYLRVKPTFNIYGAQVTSDTDASGIDLFGTGERGLPTFEQFLRQTPYTRLMWWPQNGVNRMSVWQAARIEPTAGFKPQPYLEMGSYPTPESLAGSLFYTLIGNLLFVSSIPEKLQDWYAHFQAFLEGAPDPNACPGELRPKPANGIQGVMDTLHRYFEEGFKAAMEVDHLAAALNERVPMLYEARKAMASAGAQALSAVPSDPLHLPAWLAKLITGLVEDAFQKIVDTTAMLLVAWILQNLMPWIITPVLRMFVPNDTQYFWEKWLCGLPMDNQMDDQLWNTEFTELWIPLDKWADVMKALQTFYAGGGDARAAYEATGSFSCEIYAAPKSKFWMSPAYGTDVLRIDVFWFGLNQVPPTTEFYPQFWSLLKQFAYRPHWGKYLGPTSNYLQNLPRLQDFLTLRETLDPKGIFLTDYWKQALGITPYVPPDRTVNLLDCVPTGPGAIATGDKIKLGMVTLDGTDIVVGDGTMVTLSERAMVASGTYDFTWEGKTYKGTWKTSMERLPNGHSFALAETFTGDIDMKDAFESDALQMGSGESTTISYTQATEVQYDFPVIDIQTYQNEAPGKQARIKIAGPLPVFLYAIAYYVNASYFDGQAAS
jgi:hypothetical protein